MNLPKQIDNNISRRCVTSLEPSWTEIKRYTMANKETERIGYSPIYQLRIIHGGVQVTSKINGRSRPSDFLLCSKIAPWRAHFLLWKPWETFIFSRLQCHNTYLGINEVYPEVTPHISQGRYQPSSSFYMKRRFCLAGFWLIAVIVGSITD